MKIEKIIVNNERKEWVFLGFSDSEIKPKELIFRRMIDFTDFHVPKTIKFNLVYNHNFFVCSIPFSSFLTNDSYTGARWEIQNTSIIEEDEKIPTDVLTDSLYGVSIKIIKNKINFIITDNAVKTVVESIVERNGKLLIDVDIQGIKTCEIKEAQLLIKLRVTKELWKYHYKSIKCKPVSLNKFEIDIEDLFKIYSEQEQNVWDFRLLLVNLRGQTRELLVFGSDIRFNFTKNDNESISIFSNAGKTVSSIYKKDDTKLEVTLDSYIENGTDISLIFSEKSNKMISKIIFAKKDTILNDQETFIFKEVKVTENKGKLESSFNIKNLLDGASKTSKESWEIYAEKISEHNTIKVDENINSSYLECSSRTKIKLFNNNGKLSAYTHDGSFDRKESKVRIGVFGTCFSRSMFRAQPFFNGDYKKYYDCVFTQFHSSMISLASEKIDFDEEIVNQINPTGIEYVRRDFNKESIKQLLGVNPDYVLVDFYMDACQPVVKVSETQYFTLSMYLRYTQYLEELENVEILTQKVWSDYYQLWKKSVTKFMEDLLEIVDEEKIIIVQGRFAEKYLNAKNEIVEYSFIQKIRSDNYYWSLMDNYVLSKYDKIRTLDLRNTKFVGDPKNPLGASASHYTHEYYKHSMDLLNKIIFEDLI